MTRTQAANSSTTLRDFVAAMPIVILFVALREAFAVNAPVRFARVAATA